MDRETIARVIDGKTEAKNAMPLSFDTFLDLGRALTKKTSGKTAAEIKKDIADFGYDTSKVDEYFRRMKGMGV